MPKLSELFTAQIIAAYYTEAATNRVPYLGETLFPARKKNGLDLRWVKTHAGLPVSLNISSFDTKTEIRPREGFEILATSMPFFKEGMSIREEDRQELLRVLESGDAYIRPILANIYNDAANLIEGANVVNERMRMQLLSTGVVNIQDKKGKKLKYDYQFKSAHKATLTGSDKWSDPTADVNAQIETWLEKIESDTGERPTRGIMTTKTLNYLKKNNQVLAELKPLLATQAAPLRTDAVLQWFREAFNLNIVRYNKMYLNELGGTGAKFYPDDTFTLLPAGSLGNTWFGTTPEEADLMGGANANVQIVNTGVAVTSFTTTDPVNVNVKASQIALPSFEAADKVFIATVA